MITDIHHQGSPLGNIPASDLTMIIQDQVQERTKGLRKKLHSANRSPPCHRPAPTQGPYLSILKGPNLFLKVLQLLEVEVYRQPGYQAVNGDRPFLNRTDGSQGRLQQAHGVRVTRLVVVEILPWETTLLNRKVADEVLLSPSQRRIPWGVPVKPSKIASAGPTTEGSMKTRLRVSAFVQPKPKSTATTTLSPPVKRCLTIVKHPARCRGRSWISCGLRQPLMACYSFLRPKSTLVMVMSREGQTCHQSASHVEVKLTFPWFGAYNRGECRNGKGEPLAGLPSVVQSCLRFPLG